VYRFTTGPQTGRYFTRGGCSREPHNRTTKLNHIIYLATTNYLGGWDLEEDVFGEFNKQAHTIQYVEVTIQEVYNG